MSLSDLIKRTWSSIKDPQPVDRLKNPLLRLAAQMLVYPIMHAKYDIRYAGLENLKDAKRPYIIGANHVRIADGLVIPLVASDLEFALAKEECWLNPFYRLIVPRVGGIPTVRTDDRKAKVVKARYSDEVYDWFISSDKRFDFSKYIPNRHQELIMEDIKTTLTPIKDQERILIDNVKQIDAIILAKYVLLHNRNVMMFPQGTRDEAQGFTGAKNGMAKILYDLATQHETFASAIPCGLRYDYTRWWRPTLHVSFGPPFSMKTYVDNYGPDHTLVIPRFTQDFMGDVERLHRRGNAPLRMLRK